MQLIHKLRFGDAIVVVSGLPRSGTSMLMLMLRAGGMPILMDDIRGADEDNPKGYFELERVKRLDGDSDKAWLRNSRGKAIKVISHLLKALPDDNRYRVILSKRDVAEVIKSQNIMLRRRGEGNPVADEKAAELYSKHIIGIQAFARHAPNFELLPVDYKDAVANPLQAARTINEFLGGTLDVDEMSKAVDDKLYRNRSGNGEREAGSCADAEISREREA